MSVSYEQQDSDSNQRHPLLCNPDLFDTRGDSSSSSSDDEGPISRVSRKVTPPPRRTETKRRSYRKSTSAGDKPKPQRLNKLEVSKMHSDSQRMIRDSTISLPKYQPKMKTLDHFLTRLKDRSSASSLRPVPPPLPTSCHDNETTPTLRPVTPSSEEKVEEASQVTTATNHVTTTALESNWCDHTPEDSLLPWQPSLEGDSSSVGPRLSLASDWEEEGSTAIVLTPVERLQQRFIKHAQLVGGETSKPHPLPVAEENTVIVSDELMSQLSNRPGAVRSHFKSLLHQQLSRQQAEQHRIAQEERKLLNEEEYDEILDDEQELTDEEEELSMDEEEDSPVAAAEEQDRSSDEHSELSDDEDSDDDDGVIVTVSRKQSRVIDSDDEDTPLSVSAPENTSSTHEGTSSVPDDPLLSVPENTSSTPENTSSTPENTSSTPENTSFVPENTSSCVSEGTSSAHENTSPAPEGSTSSAPTTSIIPVLDSGVGLSLEEEDSQRTQLVEEEEEDGDLSLVQSLIPAQQVRRELSEELFTPAVTRQNSTISSRSDKMDSDSTLPSWQGVSQHLVLDEDTQLLDNEGYLCLRRGHHFSRTTNDVFQGSGRGHPALSNNTTSSSQFMQEILGLPKPHHRHDNISRLADNLEESQDAIIGLCSGVFPATPFASLGKVDQAASSATSDGRSVDSSSARHSDPEDDNMPLLTKKRKRRKAPQTRSERLDEFVESEAELSGSDIGDDDEEDEGQDEYEEDEAAGSDVPDSENVLWDQVNKAHMKMLLADDKAEIRNVKERFLIDGDLYEDGLALQNGFFRTRRFAQAGSDYSADLFGDNDRGLDEDGMEGMETTSEECSQLEARRRKERLEKEEFIRQCTAQSLLDCDEDSQSILSLIKDTSCSSSHGLTGSRGNKRPRCGSFLKHKPSTLRRLSSYTASSPAVSNTVGKSFVFQTDSNSSSATNTKVKTHLKSGSKRPRLDKSISLPSSTATVSLPASASAATTGSVFDKLKM